MTSSRSDRPVRMLATLASIAYYGFLVGAVVVLVTTPMLKTFTDGDPAWAWGLPVPALVLDSEATVLTRWGPARLEVEDVRASVRLPLAMLPWWLFALLWTHAAAAAALILLFLHHLRRILRRARDGAPFDARNALGLRHLGWLLVGLALVNGVAEFIAAAAVRRGIVSGPIVVPAGLHFDVHLVLVALALLALAEVFRRGADLEHEQSLVI